MLKALPRARGYTLIEMAISLTVFAIVALSIAPFLGTWTANTQIRGASEALLAGLQKARMEAMRRNEVVRFSLVSATNGSVLDASCALSSTSASWVISRNNPAGKCDVAVSDTTDPRTIDSYAAGVHARNVVVAAVDAGGSAATSVSFDGFGRVVGSGGIARIDVRNTSTGNDYRPLRVLVGNNGVRLCDPRVTETGDPRAC